MSASDYGINADDREHDLLAKMVKLRRENGDLRALLRESRDRSPHPSDLRARIDAAIDQARDHG